MAPGDPVKMAKAIVDTFEAEAAPARLRGEVERQVPSVAGNIAYTELSTPVSTRHFMNYGRGEIYGIAATPARFGIRGLGARTPIRGLYLTGQDVCGLGVVGALFGGVISASVALGKNLLSAVSKPRPAQNLVQCAERVENPHGGAASA